MEFLVVHQRSSWFLERERGRERGWFARRWSGQTGPSGDAPHFWSASLPIQLSYRAWPLCYVMCLHPLSPVLQESSLPPYSRGPFLSTLPPEDLSAFLVLITPWPMLPSPPLSFFPIPSPYLSTLLSWPLALAPALAPAPAPARAPGAPRAAGASRRVAAGCGTGAGALAPGQEAWSAVGEPGLFCSTRQRGIWAQAGGEHRCLPPCPPNRHPSSGSRVEGRPSWGLRRSRAHSPWPLHNTCSETRGELPRREGPGKGGTERPAPSLFSSGLQSWERIQLGNLRGFCSKRAGETSVFDVEQMLTSSQLEVRGELG